MKSEKYVIIATGGMLNESFKYNAGNFLRDSTGSVIMVDTVEEAQKIKEKTSDPAAWIVTNSIPECSIFEAMKAGVKMRPTTVTLNMTDEFTGKKIKRTIDISNAMTSGSTAWELRDKNAQRKALEQWIEDRGNEQHDTILKLDSWTIQ